MLNKKTLKYVEITCGSNPYLAIWSKIMHYQIPKGASFTINAFSEKVRCCINFKICIEQWCIRFSIILHEFYEHQMRQFQRLRNQSQFKGYLWSERVFRSIQLCYNEYSIGKLRKKCFLNFRNRCRIDVSRLSWTALMFCCMCIYSWCSVIYLPFCSCPRSVSPLRLKYTVTINICSEK